MQILLTILCGGTLAFTVVQVIFVLVFAVRSRSTRTAALSDDRLPKVAVIVGLRGADPYLLESMKRLMTLDYPQYEVHLVVDSRDDPAWQVVERAIRETQARHVHVEEFRDCSSNGPVNSTNSKIVQAVRGLDESVEVIAMMDADAMPYANWLRDLVTPLVLDDSVGATYGNRWFVPPQGNWGSICRYLWNVSAVPPMDLLRIPWGGTFAIQAEVVRNGNLVDEWARVIAFDAASKEALKKQGRSLKFVPPLIMLNAEECSLPFSVNFVRRQLTWTFLYHPQGGTAVAKPVIVAGLVFGTWLCGLLAVVGGETAAAWWALSCAAVHWIMSIGCVFAVEFAVRQIVHRRGDSVRWLSLKKILKITMGIPLTLLVELIAAVQAVCCRRVQWRGLVLEIVGPNDIRVIHKTRAADRHSTGIPISC